MANVCSAKSEASETQYKQKERRIQEALRFAESFIEIVREPLLLLDSSLRAVKANRSFYDSFKITAEETEGNSIYDLGNRQWDTPMLRTLLEDILLRDNKPDNYVIEHEFEGIGGRIMLYNARLITQEETGSAMIVLTIENITEHNRAEETIQKNLEREDIATSRTANDNLKLQAEKLRKTLRGTINALSMMVESRDPYTSGHQRKVSRLARAIAQDMALPSDTIDNIRTAGSIHDIGKITIPIEILSKPGKLTDVEFGLIKAHPQTGYDVLKDSEVPYPIAEIVLQHHERLNGSGYPRGLVNGEILLESEIIMVADVVDAIASHRPYRTAQGIPVALEEIEKNKDVLYNASVVEVCLKLFREKEFAFE